MFIAVAASLIFTLIYGYVAAKSRCAERVLIPLLDVLQSAPAPGFLSITVTDLIALFPGSLVGLELAPIPANLLFPFATLFFLRAGIDLDWGASY